LDALPEDAALSRGKSQPRHDTPSLAVPPTTPSHQVCQACQTLIPDLPLLPVVSGCEGVVFACPRYVPLPPCQVQYSFINTTTGWINLLRCPQADQSRFQLALGEQPKFSRFVDNLKNTRSATALQSMEIAPLSSSPLQFKVYLVDSLTARYKMPSTSSLLSLPVDVLLVIRDVISSAPFTSADPGLGLQAHLSLSQTSRGLRDLYAFSPER
jgi:hypothetical protein